MSEINLKLDIEIRKTITVQIRKDAPGASDSYPWDWYLDDENESSIRYKTVEEAVEAAKAKLS